MKERFIDKKFTADSKAIIARAIAICEHYATQGYDLSLRQLYYQFVTKNWLKNTDQNYKRLGGIVSDARMAGLMDWDWIKDRGRSTVTNTHWDNPGQIVLAAAQSYRVNSRADQPYHIELMVEKQALEGVLEPECRRLDIGFTANKGYSSSSHMYEVGKRLEDLLDSGKQVVILYLGDHDPSGIDMTRDVGDRLRTFANRPGDEEAIIVERVALNMDQVRKYNPPENPTKLTDARAQSYLELYGESCWELDALDPAVLANLVRTATAKYTEDDLRDALIEKQNEDRKALLEFAKTWVSVDPEEAVDMPEDDEDPNDEL
jgi:hypothetical protein